jgi:type I restriction enzyme S subunit
MDLKPYPEARTITLSWLQTVPPHWDVRRIKTLLREHDHRTKTGEERLLSLRMREGIVDHLESGGKPVRPTDLIGYKIVEAGVLIMNRMRASSGLFGVASIGGLVSPDYATFRPALSANTSYLLYLFKTPMLAEVFRAESRGLGTGEAGFLRLYTDRFGAIEIPVPPIEEQRLIVRFLDTHGALTARLIRAKQRLIKLLEEQKQAIIHRAVTRGLDPNARLKPSGIPWLGDVPAHWQFRKLKQLTHFLNGLAFKPSDWESTGTPIIRIQNLNGSNIFNYTSREDLSGRLRIKPGDLLFSWSGNRGTSFGPFIWNRDFEGYLNQHIFKLEGYSLHREYFAHLLRAVTRHIEDETHGIIGLVHVTKPELGSVVVPVAPEDEQRSITQWIKKEAARLTAASDGARQEIALLREFRGRLVADVVTGKLDVRLAASALPEITESDPIDEPADGEDLEEALDDIEDEMVAA